MDKEFNIYGIFIEDKCVYIGKTTRDIHKRFMEHKYRIDEMDRGEYKGTQWDLYWTLSEARKEGKEMGIRVLLSRDMINTEHLLRDYELQCMELCLISMYKDTLLNIEGISKPYKFRY